MFEDLKEESKTFKGYVQQISYEPFNTVLYTEKSWTAANEHIIVGGGVFHIDVYKVDEQMVKLYITP